MEKKDLRIIFMGTPEFAVGTLKRLVESEYNVVAVVTQPDKPVGRHQDNLQPSAVKRYALEHDIPVLQPIKMKDPDFAEQLASYKADLQVVVAFRMLPEIIWSMPRPRRTAAAISRCGPHQLGYYQRRNRNGSHHILPRQEHRHGAHYPSKALPHPRRRQCRIRL